MEEFQYVPNGQRTNADKKSLLIAYLLALPPIGIFGAHRLYLGHHVHFTWYMLTGGNMLLGWITDLIFMTWIVEKKNESIHVKDSYDIQRKYFINTLVLWYPVAGLFGAHRYYHRDIAHGVFYTLTAGNAGMAWIADAWRISSLAKQERHDTFDSFLLWLPPAGLLGGHRYYSGHLIHAISYTFTGGNFMLGWLIDAFRLPTLMLNSPRRIKDKKKRMEMAKKATDINFNTMEDLPGDEENMRTEDYDDEAMLYGSPTRKRVNSAPLKNAHLSVLDAYALWFPPLGLFGLHNYYLGRLPCAIIQSVLPPIGLGVWIMDACYIPRFIAKQQKGETPVVPPSSASSSSSAGNAADPETYVALVEMGRPDNADDDFY